MSSCPVCDQQPSDYAELLERIGDPSLLTTLACDAAGRVAHLTREPARSRAWLDVARAWQSNPEAVTQAFEAVRAEETEVLGDGSGPLTTQKATIALSDAVLAAKYASDDPDWQREPVGWAAIRAAQAATNPKAEELWLLRHARRLACACPPKLIEADPASPRLRQSLLAN